LIIKTKNINNKNTIKSKIHSVYYLIYLGQFFLEFPVKYKRNYYYNTYLKNEVIFTVL